MEETATATALKEFDRNKFHCFSFAELSTNDLFDLMQLRQEVFVVEQNCAYLDADKADKASFHVFYRDVELYLRACARIVPPGYSYDDYCSIGRVATHQSCRRNGLGTEIMKYTIERYQELFPDTPLKISAQVYVLKFYEKLGFQKEGPEYLEDDIPHQGMIYTPQTFADSL